MIVSATRLVRGGPHHRHATRSTRSGSCMGEGPLLLCANRRLLIYRHLAPGQSDRVPRHAIARRRPYRLVCAITPHRSHHQPTSTCCTHHHCTPWPAPSTTRSSTRSSSSSASSSSSPGMLVRPTPLPRHLRQAPRLPCSLTGHLLDALYSTPTACELRPLHRRRPPFASYPHRSSRVSSGLSLSCTTQGTDPATATQVPRS